MKVGRVRAALLIVAVLAGTAGGFSRGARAEEGADLSAELNVPAGAERKTVVLSAVRTVKADLTVPPQVGLRFEGAGTVEVVEGATLTVNGPLEAPLTQVFRGGGKVVFGTGSVERVHPQWWGARPDDEADDTAAIQSAIDSLPGGGVVFFPGGRWDLSATVKFREGLTLEGVYGRSVLYCPKGVPAILQRPDTTPPPAGIHYNVATRVNGLRVARLTLDGGPTDSEVGLDLTNVGYAVIEDVNILHCRKGLLMGELSIYNNIINPGIGVCGTAIEVNIGTMQNNVFGGHIGAVNTGLLINVTSALNVYGVSFDAYTTGVDIQRGDSVGLYNLYFDSVPPAVSIKVAPSVSSCIIVNPRFSGPTPKGIDNQSKDTVVLDSSYDVETILPSELLKTKVLYTAGISATDLQANNLRGQVVLAGDNASAAVRFPAPEPDDRYFVVATCVSTTGDPPAGARHVFIQGKSGAGFDVCLEAAPGPGNSVTVDWILVR